MPPQSTRLKYLATVVAGQSPDGAEVNSEGTGLPFLQGCAEFEHRHPTANRYCVATPKIARSGSWLISVRAPVGTLNYADRDYGIGRGLAAVHANNIEQRFLGYALSTKRKELQAIATGSTFQAISTAQLAELRVESPSIIQQKCIADFLDERTTRIDGLIAKKTRLLELLAEQRQALITRAVTRGLDPSAPMKPSGIDWLGDIPAHWDVRRLKFIALVRISNVDKIVSDEETPICLCNYTDVYYNDVITSDLPFMQGSATIAEIERFKLRHDQVIITKDSESWDDIGIPAYVPHDLSGVVCGYHLAVTTPSTPSILYWRIQ